MRLAQARVLVVGAGGLGCTVIPALAGAGVGNLIRIDPDRIELTNLHRQTLYMMDDIGTPKAIAAARRVEVLNTDCRPTPLVTRLDPANAPDLIAAADVIVDAADSFAVTYTLSDLCLAAGKPLISATVIGLSGYACGFCSTAPSYRAVFTDLPAQGIKLRHGGGSGAGSGGTGGHAGADNSGPAGWVGAKPAGSHCHAGHGRLADGRVQLCRCCGKPWVWPYRRLTDCRRGYGGRTAPGGNGAYSQWSASDRAGRSGQLAAS